MKQLLTTEIGVMMGVEVYGKASVTGVKVDSRLIEPGDLFVALRGEQVDGHDYASLAIEKGAVALMVDHKLDLPISQIIVSDTLRGLTDFARLYLDTLSLRTIAITGSNGKTSTKDMLYSILSNIAPTIATYENQNTEIGTCLTIFRCNHETRYGIFEMGLDYPDEISAMTHIVKPDLAILTSLDQAHMTSFDNMEHLGREKFSIFDRVENRSHCFYQGDYEIYRTLAHDEVSFGFHENNDYRVESVSSSNTGIAFTINGRHYESNLLGRHQASNAAGVVACLRTLGLNDDVINEGLKSVALTSMRTDIFKHKEALIMFDAYKSSPESALYAIDTFNNYAFEGNRYIVLADMYELGEGTLLQHQRVLDAALVSDAKRIFLHGKEFKKVFETNVDSSVSFYETKDAMKLDLESIYEEKSMVLFKGSRYYELETLLERGSA